MELIFAQMEKTEGGTLVSDELFGVEHKEFETPVQTVRAVKR